MIKVDEVYPIDINTTIGPTGTIKRLFRNRDYFKERGYDMTIYANHPIGKKFLTYRYEMRELINIPGEADCTIMPDTINSNRWKSRLKSILKKMIGRNPRAAAHMMKKRSKGNAYLIQQYLSFVSNPDIIVFHEVGSCYHYLKGNHNKHAKIVLFLHTDGSDDAMFRASHPNLVGSEIHKGMLKRLMFVYKGCDRVVLISNIAHDTFCMNHPEFAGKAFAVVNGIDDMPIEDVTPSSNYNFRLCCTGSVAKRKGQYLIIEAMHRMDKTLLAQLHLTIMGVGPDYSRLMSLVSDYHLEEHVTFLGNVPNKDVHQRLCSENIYILMSNNEGLPISIIEAMRAGLPVISTNVAGIPEEVDECNGVLIEPEVNELVNVLNRLPEYHWEEMGRNSRLKFEKEFTFDRMRERYCNVFDSLSI